MWRSSKYQAHRKVVHPTEAYAGQFLGGFWEASLRCPMLRKAMALAEKSSPGFDTPLAHRRPRDPSQQSRPPLSPGSRISSELNPRNQPLDIGGARHTLHASQGQAGLMKTCLIEMVRTDWEKADSLRNPTESPIVMRNLWPCFSIFLSHIFCQLCISNG